MFQYYLAGFVFGALALFVIHKIEMRNTTTKLKKEHFDEIKKFYLLGQLRGLENTKNIIRKSLNAGTNLTLEELEQIIRVEISGIKDAKN